jgi:hypothetical protein
LSVIDDGGRLEPHVGPLVSGGAYFGAIAAAFERHLGLRGDDFLYLGDHMLGDVHVCKRALRWRTGLILRELELELVEVDKTRDLQLELADLMRRKEDLEQEQCQLRLALQRHKHGYGPRPEVHSSEANKRLARIRAEIIALDERISPVAARAGRVHSERWGLLMRAGNDKSQLARQIERYADVYTSRVSNLLFVSPFAYLRSPRGSLPHDAVPSRSAEP